jgi:hypothetical protein
MENNQYTDDDGFIHVYDPETGQDSIVGHEDEFLEDEDNEKDEDDNDFDDKEKSREKSEDKEGDQEEEPEDQDEESEENEQKNENPDNPEEPEGPEGPEASEGLEAGPEGAAEGAGEAAGEAAAEAGAEAGTEIAAETAAEGAIAGGSVLWWAVIALLIILGICLLLWFFFIIYSVANPDSGDTSSTVGLCTTLKSPSSSSTAGFLQLPKSKNYSGGSGSGQWGTPEMIAVIETVLAEWNTKHPDLKVHVSDISKINGGNFYPPHHSHQLGVDVDLTGCYDKKYAIELAKLLFDTKAIKYIFYNDSSVNSEVNSYARANKLPGRMQPESGHEDHFHVRIKDGLYTKACSL